MAQDEIPFEHRIFMEQAVEEMRQSTPEPRKDGKASPKVGAVLIKPDGTVVSAHRCELRHGDHAEFTLIERKLRSEKLDGAKLFATLEPCAPGARSHPKLGCAERIVNARIAEVWIGIEDPDPAVDGKGIEFLKEHGIQVHLFEPDLQEMIRRENAEFIAHAEARAKHPETKPKPDSRHPKEKAEPRARFEDLSRPELEHFIEKAHLGVEWGSDEFHLVLQQLGLIEIQPDGGLLPTGIGLLLFGKRPQLLYPQAIIKATYQTSQNPEDVKDFTGSLISQAEKAQEWFELRIPTHFRRERLEREEIRGFPPKVFREALINALIHRDYDLDGAPIHLSLTDEHFTVKSPGEPVEPVTLEQLQSLKAPVLSRNPKILYVFNQLELVEQRGLGQQTFESLPEKFGLPKPGISFKAPYLELVFKRSVAGQTSISGQTSTTVLPLTEEEAAGYEFVRQQKRMTKKEYAKKFGYSDRQAERHLAKFRKLNLIEQKGVSRSIYYEIPT
ncbi:MAG: ATP-binding protein [Candidatus Sericytochromatia bacterium]